MMGNALPCCTVFELDVSAKPERGRMLPNCPDKMLVRRTGKNVGMSKKQAVQAKAYISSMTAIW